MAGSDRPIVSGLSRQSFYRTRSASWRSEEGIVCCESSASWQRHKRRRPKLERREIIA